LNLPDEFLEALVGTTVTRRKKSTKEANRTVSTRNYRDGLKWQLIQNKIIPRSTISKHFTLDQRFESVGIREQLLQQFAAYYGMQQADDEMMDGMVHKIPESAKMKCVR
jgi:hypothetical protein